MSKKYYGGTGTNKRFAMHSPGNEYRDNGDDELDDFFDGLFFVKTRIALAIESLFKALMYDFRKIPGQCTYDARDRMLSGPH